MRRNWIVVASLALAIGLLAVASAAAEDDPAKNSEGAVPTAPEAKVAPSESKANPFQVAPLATNCFSLEVCVWTFTNYTGTRETVACDGAYHWFPNGKNSAKNRCGNRRSWLINSDGSSASFLLR